MKTNFKNFTKKAILSIIILSLYLVNLSNCFEDKESFQKRLNYSKQISKYSNNTVKVGATLTKGLTCIANDYIEYGQLLMKVPKKYSLCSYYLFPFKYEILSILLDISGLRETIGKEQRLSVYLLSYYILYYMYAPKEEIKNYIKEKKLEQYYRYEDIDESLKDIFPTIIPGSGMLDKEHYELLQSFGFPIIKGDELEGIFKYVNQRIYNSEHMEMIFPWTSDFEKFKWAYSIVMSRAFTLRVSEYLTLEGLPENSITLSKYDRWTKKNLEVNKYISPPNVGGPCLIAWMELCNHHEPQHIDLRDKRPIILDTEKGNFLYTVGHPFNPDQEITYTYTNEPSNIVLFLHYGFVISNNIFNTYRLKVEDETMLSLAQFNLCKELKCVDVNVKDPKHLSKTRYYNALLTITDESLLNYGRVLHLNKDFDKKIVLKTLANDQIISFENETKAWIYYYNTLKNNAKNINFEIQRSLKKCQKYRNKVNKIENDWIDEEISKNEWRRNKSFEDIYLLDVSYKKIITKHLLGSINHVIFNSHTELESFKAKYLA
jgi:hypothetical protein